MARIPRWIERLLIAAGVVLLGIWLVARVHRAVMSRASLREFERVAATATAPAGSTAPSAAPAPPSAAPPPSTVAPLPFPTGRVDFSLWATKRIRGYRESLSLHTDPPLAVLEIPKIGLVVPVLEGTDEVVLNRGVGHIEGTPLPGVRGNVGIAGHRDGFFRGLKDVEVGDRLRLVTTGASASYRIDRITIVRPEDVSVLDDTTGPTVTLVTCYPFYFVGDAPSRYIVRAVGTDGAR